MKRLKELEKDRAIEGAIGSSPMARERLRKAVSDLTLEKLILREAASGVKGVPDTVQWTASALNRRSP